MFQVPQVTLDPLGLLTLVPLDLPSPGPPDSQDQLAPPVPLGTLGTLGTLVFQVPQVILDQRDQPTLVPLDLPSPGPQGLQDTQDQLALPDPQVR